ncbi:MarR family transcriptional regulator [Herbiconiux sp. CPCC 205763]|uniref:MarR family transcriptional regulator n=1 Tax=Herbiconiux aconitum TaxID=2970913 RepID=A0ABT2GR68_9MICO|nr:MarR family transcriptional regulator [Herbiconiux aconitum]MCS5718067.1 MarR family transcriptional regulator [Herbiconiux aconitum]
MARDEQALRLAVEKSAATLTAAGFPKMPARLLMTLLVAESGGLTAAELAQTLGVSAAAVSGGVRYLQTLGAVHRVAQHGSRRDRYELGEDSWFTASLKNSPLYATLAGLGEAVHDALGDDRSEAALRVQDMVDFYRFLEVRMPQLLEEWEGRRGAAAEAGDPGVAAAE